MAQDKEFPDGLIFKPPRDNAPEYVKGRLSIKRDDFIKWLSNKADDWVNLDMLVGKTGNYYTSVDNWKPDPSRQTKTVQDMPDDVPF